MPRPLMRRLLLLPLLLLRAVDGARPPASSTLKAAESDGRARAHGDEAVQVDTVHVVFSNHLDMGFTDQDDVVIEQYFFEHWPRAIAIAQADPSFVFTTHAYLLSLFFDCPSALALKCPSPEQKQQLAAAISNGTIAWHAAPFNPQYETFSDPSLLTFAVQGVAHRLDRRFSLPRKRVVSLRDVPGLTRAALPHLARAGVRAISHGVNGFSAPPGVPKNAPLIWRDEASNTELLYFVHPGGYGGLKRDDGCVTHAKSRHAVCTWWNGDNGGPPANASEVQGVLEQVRGEFPEAAIVTASTLEAYMDALYEEAEAFEKEELRRRRGEGEGAAPPSWPGGAAFFGEGAVFTGEVGDTWIHGIGSDVTRLADYRAALRARRAFCGDESGGGPRGCSGGDDPGDGDDDEEKEARAVDLFSRMLLKVPEHTWGVAFGAYFGGDFTNYTNAYLHAGIGWRSSDNNDDDEDGGGLRSLPPFTPQADLPPNYAAVERSWRRQYGYLDAARQALLQVAPTAGASSSSSSSPSQKNKHPILEAWDADVAEREALAGDEAFARAAAAALEFGEEEKEEEGRGDDDHDNDDGRWRALFIRRRNDDAKDDDDDCSPFPIRLARWAFAFDRCTGGLASLRRRRWDSQGGEIDPGAEWAGGGGDGAGNNNNNDGRPARFAEFRYDVYGEQDYAPVWRDYAYVQPPWVGDFGKLNLSVALDPAVQRRKVGALPRLAASFFRRDPPSMGGGARVRLVLKFDDELVREAGAPREAWVDVREPPSRATSAGGTASQEEDALLLTAVWRRKTPTRRPEALWLRFSPGGGADVNASTWRLCKLCGGGVGSSGLSPLDIIVNGSHAMHAVSDAGVTVLSAAAEAALRERLRIASLDAALVAAGAPSPFPIPRREGDAPDLEGEGVSFNLVNNVWGTNWPMWSPWRAREVDMAFRFVLTARTEEEEEREGAVAAAARRGRAVSRDEEV